MGRPSASFSYSPPATKSALLFINNPGNVEETGFFESNENIESNEIALQTSGDSYPFAAQFNPEDAEMGIGLDFNPMMDGEEFDASFISQTIRRRFWRLTTVVSFARSVSQTRRYLQSRGR